MFSLMGNCISCLKKRREPKESITIAVLGLDCAGKTTTTKSLVGDPVDDGEAPTIGFSSFKFESPQFEVTIFDLGGGRKIRGIWRNYLAEIHGLIFVVDSTAAGRMDEAKESLASVIEHPRISGKPVLLLANKQDKPEALDEVDICELLNLETLVNVHKCPCRMETVSALQGSGRKMDINLKDGLDWLLSIVERDLDGLKKRVAEDMAAEKEKQKAEREARKERVRLQREERERKEAEERQRLGLPEEKGEEEEDVVGDSNPFKTLDINELEAKERRLKEEKKRRKELEQKAKERELAQNCGDYDGCALDSIRSDKCNNNLGQDCMHSNSNKYAEGEANGNLLSGNGTKVRLPPLTGESKEPKEAKKKKKKKKRPNLEELEDQGELLSTSLGNKSLSSLSRVEIQDPVLPSQESGGRDNLALDFGTVEPLPSLKTPRALPMPRLKGQKKSPHISSLEMQEETEASPRSLATASLEESLDEEVDARMETPTSSRGRKKKRSRLKKNKLAPATDELEMSPSHMVRVDNSALIQDPALPSSKQSWKHMEPTGSRQTVGMGSQTWSMASDLPEVEEEPRRLRPNYDDDDDIVM